MKRAIVWFRQDLRLSNNAALYNACLDCDEIYPVFIDDQSISQSTTSLGSASRAWLQRSLESLTNSLENNSSKLILKQGNVLTVLEALVDEIGATHIYWNRCYEPEVRQRDELIKSTLKEKITVTSFKGNLLMEPWQLLKQDGTPYRVFTPFWKMLSQRYLQTQPLATPTNFKSPQNWPKSLSLDELELLPQAPIPRWDIAMMEHWQVSEQAANKRFEDFLHKGCIEYKEQRDFPAIDGTSLLSAHLHFGEISPVQLFHQAHNFHAEASQQFIFENRVGDILRQIAWREFAHGLLFHFPQTVNKPLYEKYAAFKWRDDDEQLQRWQQGNTGFPIIDAGMRQLYATGYMHNRVRMIASSFLCKNLLQDWRKGEAWFRDTLVDADLANNTMGWQWVAGCGADAAPYYRIFNPLLQSQKFDEKGEYIRRWVPELAELNDKDIHQPSPEQAKKHSYPEAIIDLKATSQRALDRYADLKKQFK